MNQELPDVQAGIRKERGTRDQIANIHWIVIQKKHLCFIDYAKAFDCVDHSKLGKLLDENTRLPYLPPMKSVCKSRSNRTEHGTTDWFQIEKGIHKVVHCHPTYLSYMQSTSWKMLGWMKLKLESKLLGEIPITSECRWEHTHGRKQRGTNEPLDEAEREE